VYNAHELKKYFHRKCERVHQVSGEHIAFYGSHIYTLMHTRGVMLPKRKALIADIGKSKARCGFALARAAARQAPQGAASSASQPGNFWGFRVKMTDLLEKITTNRRTATGARRRKPLLLLKHSPHQHITSAAFKIAWRTVAA
jgi:hypothetical protein